MKKQKTKKEIKKILVIGAGPIVIGQACEFDYSGTQACKALREEGYEVVLINSNPATIMTDTETADSIYIEPMNVAFLEKIIAKEKPDSVLPTLGGQTGLNLAMELEDKGVLEKYNVHIHIPEGATPKDGPSAGITMLTSLVSLFTQRKVKKSLAMTGEITLRGKVLPVGGIKEKILAAKRARIKEILLCEENKRDIDEIKPEYLKGLTFHYVKEMSDVLALALTKEKVSGAKKL